MMKNLLLLVAATLTVAPLTHATTVVVTANPFVGPFVATSDGNLVVSGLVRVGMLTGTPASSSVADISAVFQEFDNYPISNGRLNGGATNLSPAADSFNGGLIHLWVFDGDTPSSSTEHALFTNPNPTPAAWVYPTNQGGIGDSVVISADTLPVDGDASFTPGVQFQESPSRRIFLTPIPEPSAAGLLLCASVLALGSRRR